MPVETAPAPDRSEKSERRLGLPSAVALVVGNMIGAGIFTTSGFVLADLGRPDLVLLAWLVAGSLAMAGALSYGALARRLPESGGEYYFLSKTVHPLAGFLGGWISLLAGFTAPIAVAALALQAYVAPFLGDGLRPAWIGTGAIAVAGLVHGLRLREGIFVQNFAVALKMLLIAGFVVLGALRLPDLAVMDPPPEAKGLDPGASGAPGALGAFGAFSVSLVWISSSYSGWNAAVYVASEVREPERNLSASLCLATALVILVYLALNAVFLYAAPIESLAGKAEIGAIAAGALGGEPLRRTVSLLVALALFTSISAMVMAGSRVYFRMARDGVFPRLFAARRDVPTPAVALQTALAIVVVWVSGLAELLGYIGFTLGLSAAATVGGLIALRRREGRDAVPVPGYPWLPGFFVAGTLGAAAFMAMRTPREAFMGLLTVAMGVPFYFLRRRAAG